MIPELMLLAILVGTIMRGRLTNLADAKVRHGWLVFVMLGLYLGAWGATRVPALAHMSWFSGATHIAEELALLLLAALNMRIPGVKLVFVGTLLNMAALVANGGLMPVDPDALMNVGGRIYMEEQRQAVHVRNVFMDTSTELGYLCDIISARRLFLFWPAVYSVGDLVMSVGVFVAIIRLMRTPQPVEEKAQVNA